MFWYNFIKVNKKTGLLAILVVVLMVGVYQLLLGGQKNSLSTPITFKEQGKVEIVPSKTLKSYTDPSGFSFNYPDNLSLESNELDDHAYADMQLTAKEVNGSLALKISDSKFATLDEWVKLNKGTTKETPKEVKLGSLKGVEIKTSDRLLLGNLDHGVLFTIEIPLVEERFWMNVYDKVLTDFSFVSPDVASSGDTSSSSDAISFEGEEVTE